jgi:hypothetical protein
VDQGGQALVAEMKAAGVLISTGGLDDAAPTDWALGADKPAEIRPC